ncbi:hypothetical protein [Mycobacterium botniense]|uniref:Uncharacterized protein n=1 Tax=Mycobacterium botniense TaxID=84962 RepID=A0A7I9Y280_9MYCO|nr:hypothetical protein [Mycobacterium botniense]GFG76178.1 hypothetical protein MBOT_35430 [Mycobacterium botniense]
MASERESRSRGNNLKWALGAVTLIAVVATALAVTLLLSGGSDRDPAANAPSKTGSDAASGIASANDTGPVAVITEDPSCGAWTSIHNDLASGGELLWNDRDLSVPASAWTDKQRGKFMAAAQAMRSAAAQTVGLAKLTPHRVMRELYEQFIAYARAYSERIPKYTPADNNLAGTANSASSALGAICAAITDGSAAARGPMVPPVAAPSQIAPLGNPANPQSFLTSPTPVCAEWKAALDQFGRQTADWQKIDPRIPAMLWNPEQKATNYAAASLMNTYASKLEQLGRRSGNPIFQDFAELSAQYRRAFVLAVPTYTPPDNHLANAANYASTIILGACAALAAW